MGSQSREETFHKGLVSHSTDSALASLSENTVLATLLLPGGFSLPCWAIPDGEHQRQFWEPCNPSTLGIDGGAFWPQLLSQGVSYSIRKFHLRQFKH